MGTNQSTNEKAEETNQSNSNAPTQTKRPHLTYQESFDIRNRPQPLTSRIFNKDERRNSFSSNSDSDLPSVVSYSSKKKVKRNRSNIKPPLLLYTNQNRMLDAKQKKEIFSRKKSLSSASENSQNAVMTENVENSSFDNTDIEEEINLILNDHKGDEKPWYRDPKLSSSSSTVSPIKSDKKSSSAEDVYSSKSLPTPSFYLYLTFDEDIKKSKSIEVLDDPSYFFLNYVDDESQEPSDPVIKNDNSEKDLSEKHEQ